MSTTESLSTERLAKVASTMRLVAADCETDATALDSTPFTPRGVGEALGSTLAMIAAIAKAVALLAEQAARETSEDTVSS